MKPQKVPGEEEEDRTVRSLSEKIRELQDGMMKIMASMEIIDPRTDNLSHQLPFEIQLLILQNLDYVEFTQFSTVCKAWRRIACAARQSPLFSIKQVPWLLNGLSPGHQLPKLSHHNCFYKSKRFHHWSGICGSSEGWLLIRLACDHTSWRDHCANFLLNPITRQKISLPRNPKCGYGYTLRLEVGVILPHKSADGMEVVAYFEDDSFYHWRSSQDKHWIKISGHSSGSPSISDMIYHNGNIYVIDKCSIISNDIIIIDMGSDTPHCYKSTRCDQHYPCILTPGLIHKGVKCDGELLMVLRLALSYKNDDRELLMVVRPDLACEKVAEEVIVFKYNPIGRNCWERVKSIGEKYALLVGYQSSMAIDVFTNSTSLRGNCVYLLEPEGIGCFNLGKNRLETLVPCKWKSAYWYHPIWFMPILT